MSTDALRLEISSQPDCWTVAAELASRYTASLPERGARVAVVGCGTSLYIARAYAAIRETTGQGVTDAWPAGESRLDRDYDHVLVICRSGTTTEVIEVLDRYRYRGGRARVTIITATADTPIHSRGETITLASFDEESVVQTRFATSTLALLRASLDDELGPAIAQARAILDGAAEDTLDAIRQAGQISFAGMGFGAALAEEAALKVRESTRSWVEAYHATEWRHGPMSIAEPGRAVWAFGPLIPGFERDVMQTGAHLEHHDVDPMAELVRVHLYCLLRADDLGIDPASPRSLTRSVILS